jgi:hypothetical protein
MRQAFGASVLMLALVRPLAEALAAKFAVEAPWTGTM